MATLLKIGILGAGAFASRRHLPELARDDRVTVAAACRRDAGELARFADHFQIPERYTDWYVMLAQASLDGVLIATPHDQHYMQAQAALERGLHVLLEKPMALTTAEAEALAALAREKRLVLAVAFNPPYWRHTQALRDGIQSGRIGELEAVDLRGIGSSAGVFGKAPLPENLPGVVRPTLFRADVTANGGGQLMDGGGHLLSELLWVTGRRALEITALMDSTPNDMRSVLLVRLEGNLLATITTVADSNCPTRRLRSLYEGAGGSAVAEGLPFRLRWPGTDGASGEWMSEDALPPVPSPVTNWINGILTGRAPLGSPEHGVQVTRLLEAAYLSAGTGRTVSVSAP